MTEGLQSRPRIEEIGGKANATGWYTLCTLWSDSDPATRLGDGPGEHINKTVRRRR